MSERPGLLGMSPARKFKVFREEFPAIIRFNGKLYMEKFDIDHDVEGFLEVSEDEAKPWLEAKNP